MSWVVVAVLVLLLVVLLLIGAWAYQTAHRLDRLHQPGVPDGGRPQHSLVVW